jgi:hypothetical protein
MTTQEISKKTRIISWVISGLVILFLLFDGIGKIAQPEEVVSSTVELGYNPDVLTGLGILLLISTILYALPQTAFWGALLLTAYLGGAVATHVRVGNPLFSHTLFPVYMGILLWLGLYLRSHLLRQLVAYQKNN